MLDVYCIPGMGVDGRLFKNLELDNCKLHHIKWLTPHKNESLASYALRLAAQIDTQKPFVLIGVSFGGMCAVEIARKLHPLKTFVISGSKSIDEVPPKLKIWKYIPLYKSISDKTYKKAAMILKKQFGVSNEDQAKKFLEMLNTAPDGYFKGAVHCIMSWNSDKQIPKSVIHIHGTNDQILPYKKVKTPDYTIDRGTHFMIINRATEINKILNKELKNFV